MPILTRSGARRPNALSALLALALAAPAAAYDVVEIEEHWTLSVGGPETNRSAPQVTMAMSPTGDTNGKFFLVTLNHWNEPQFAPGGVQVQQWCGEACLGVANAPAEAPLHHDGETVQWVQRMKLQDGSLTFEVSGVSESWGEFGGADLRLTDASELTRLNGYLPAVSINQSGIGFAGNRVSALTLERIRWWDADGQAYEMVAPIDIDSDLDP